MLTIEHIKDFYTVICKATQQPNLQDMLIYFRDRYPTYLIKKNPDQYLTHRLAIQLDKIIKQGIYTLPDGVTQDCFINLKSLSPLLEDNELVETFSDIKAMHCIGKSHPVSFTSRNLASQKLNVDEEKYDDDSLFLSAYQAKLRAAYSLNNSRQYVEAREQLEELVFELEKRQRQLHKVYLIELQECFMHLRTVCQNAGMGSHDIAVLKMALYYAEQTFDDQAADAILNIKMHIIICLCTNMKSKINTSQYEKAMDELRMTVKSFNEDDSFNSAWRSKNRKVENSFHLAMKAIMDFAKTLTQVWYDPNGKADKKQECDNLHDAAECIAMLSADYQKETYDKYQQSYARLAYRLFLTSNDCYNIEELQKLIAAFGKVSRADLAADSLTYLVDCEVRLVKALFDYYRTISPDQAKARLTLTNIKLKIKQLVERTDADKFDANELTKLAYNLALSGNFLVLGHGNKKLAATLCGFAIALTSKIIPERLDPLPQCYHQFLLQLSADPGSSYKETLFGLSGKKASALSQAEEKSSIQQNNLSDDAIQSGTKKRAFSKI